MNLGFSAEHEAIRDEFRKVLAGADPRAGFEAEQGAAPLGDAPLWQRLAELGWLATLVPEVHGGSGLEPVVACVLAEEIGRSLPRSLHLVYLRVHGLGLAAMPIAPSCSHGWPMEALVAAADRRLLAAGAQVARLRAPARDALGPRAQ
jgi:alkylation response protein AidB-like acyl-CoA dehydrogenase